MMTLSLRKQLIEKRKVMTHSFNKAVQVGARLDLTNRH